MPTYIKPSSPPSDGMRLNYLEEKVRNLNPGEAPDLTAVISGLNRLYELALRGSQHTNNDAPITYDLPDTAFWGMTSAVDGKPRSIISVTYGNTDYLDRVKDVPLYQQLLGISAVWDFKAASSIDQDRASVVGSIFGSTSFYQYMKNNDRTVVSLVSSSTADLETMLADHGSVYDAMYGGMYCGTPDAATNSLLEMILELRSRNDNPESRVQWLENNP